MVQVPPIKKEEPAMKTDDSPMEVDDDTSGSLILLESTVQPQRSPFEECPRNSKVVDFEQMRIPGEIENQFPNDITVQQEIRNLLNHPMPEKERRRNFEEFMNKNNKPIKVQNYSAHLYHFYMNKRTRIETSDNE